MVRVIEEEEGKSFPFKVGGKTTTKTDCKNWGTVKYKYLTVPGCEKSEAKHAYWCKFGCLTCTDYEQEES